uniref:Retinoblastoma binding protein n=1 Tax=Echinococcus granulosus TaxID=6210 RepID=A0A068WCP2_ECHGR|nr:retinoblastoma binding protein [Echinococcus granulosus]
MASEVYFKFKSSVKTDSIPFDGSAISVKELKNAIKNKCCLRSADLDLKLEDSTGKEYSRDAELIPKFTSIIVRRVPKPNGEPQKRRPAQSSVSRDKLASQTDTCLSNIANLADSDLPEEEKIRLMIDRSSETYSAKNYTVKAKAFGIPPPTYTCHKCNQAGHWIHDCPGIKDVRGNLVDSKTVKRPTGIPQDFLVRVDPGTPGAYLDKCGRYMVPIKDAEAYSQKKKEKRAFSLEENPPYVPPQERTPSAGLVCPLCKKLLKEAVIITCCGTSYCNECITNHCFVAGSQKCPNCGAPAEKYDSAIIENAAMRRAVTDWLRAGSSPEVSNQRFSPEVIQTKGTPEPEKVVRRLLKPKQPASIGSGNAESGSVNQEIGGESKESVLELADLKKENDATVKPELSASNLSDSKTLSFPSKSESSITHVKSTPIESHTPPVVSNTSSVANLPCANSFGAENVTSMLPTLPNVTSLYNGAPLVFPGEGASLANAVYSANLAASLTAVGAAQAPLNTVFPSNSLISSSSVWPSVDLSLLGGVDQSGFSNPGNVFPSVNPLVDLHGAVGGDKLLSKEEFYRMKRRLLEKSHRRRPRSRDSLHSRRRCESRRRAAADYYYRRREEERRLRKRSPPRRRRSRSSGSDRRPTRGDGVAVEDYDTWKRRKERRLQIEAAGGRHFSPLHGPCRSASSNGSPLPTARREASPHEYSSDRNRRYPEAMDKSRLRSPFYVGSPIRKTLEETSPNLEGTCRHQDRRYRGEDSEYSRKRSLSKEGSAVPDIVSSPPENADGDLDAKALRKLRKEQKRKAKKEKKLAKRAARAQRAAAAAAAAGGRGAGEGIYDNLDGVSPVVPGEDDRDDGESSKSKRDRKKRKKKHRHERDLESDSGSDSRIKRKKKDKSRKYPSTDEEPDELVEVC